MCDGELQEAQRGLKGTVKAQHGLKGTQLISAWIKGDTVKAQRGFRLVELRAANF